jgi:hypothetical protein
MMQPVPEMNKVVHRICRSELLHSTVFVFRDAGTEALESYYRRLGHYRFRTASIPERSTRRFEFGQAL